MQRLRITGSQACTILFPSYPGWPGHLQCWKEILLPHQPKPLSPHRWRPPRGWPKWRDINSVAGVLKLYFRGLENPLFPKERFQDLISTISKYFPGGQPIAPQVFIEVEGLALYPARHGRGTLWEKSGPQSAPRPSCIGRTMDWWTWYIYVQQS